MDCVKGGVSVCESASSGRLKVALAELIEVEACFGHCFGIKLKDYSESVDTLDLGWFEGKWFAFNFNVCVLDADIHEDVGIDV